MHYKEGKAGPLTRDAHWNIAMDRLAETFRLNYPRPLSTVYCASGAALVHNNQVLVTKVGHTKIKDLWHREQLCRYIQEKEQWNDTVFESIDWPAFEQSLQNLTIHKRINVMKYIFNWQNTGRQKQLFENSQASFENREEQDVGRCPMGCGQHEDLQHYLQCTKLHDARAINRSFGGLKKWMKKVHTHTLRLSLFSLLASDTGPLITIQKRYWSWPMTPTETDLKKPFMSRRTRLDGAMSSKAGLAQFGEMSKWIIMQDIMQNKTKRIS